MTNLAEDTPVFIGKDLINHFNISKKNENGQAQLIFNRNKSCAVKVNPNAVVIKCNKTNESQVKLVRPISIRSHDRSNNKVIIDPVMVEVEKEIEFHSREDRIQDEEVVDIQLPEHMQKIEINSKLEPLQIYKLTKLLIEFSDCFASSDVCEPLNTNIRHKINTGNNPPIRSKLYRLPDVHKQVIEKQIEEWLKKNVIEASESPWASGVVVVTKKDGTFRVCGDFRRLNEITKKDAYPTPSIDEQKSYFTGAKVFSSIDLKDAYLQVIVDIEDREKTAIITHVGLYQFIRMPFGLTNAPPTYLRIIDSKLREYIGRILAPYFDDLNVYSKTFDEHLDHLRKIFTRMREANFKAKSSKCKFGFDETPWMSFVIGVNGIKPDSKTVEAINNMNRPTNVQEVRRFTGLINYYRVFIQDVAKIAKPLYELTKKNSGFQWTDKKNSFC